MSQPIEPTTTLSFEEFNRFLEDVSTNENVRAPRQEVTRAHELSNLFMKQLNND